MKLKWAILCECVMRSSREPLRMQNYENCSKPSLNLYCLEASKVEVEVMRSSVWNCWADFHLFKLLDSLERSCWNGWYHCEEAMSYALVCLLRVGKTALKQLRADPFNKDTQTDTHSFLKSHESFELLALLLIWIYVLGSVDCVSKDLPRTYL